MRKIVLMGTALALLITITIGSVSVQVAEDIPIRPTGITPNTSDLV